MVGDAVVTGPAVSVIMPVRNGERWLVEACRSVLAQSLSDIELVVIDDGSDDSTPSLLAELAASDTRVRHARLSPQGLVSALNLGLRLASAPLIARLDADDIALPDRLVRQVAYFAANPQALLLGTWADTIDEEGQWTGRLTPETAPDRLAAILGERNPFIHSTVMMRAHVVREIGGYRHACEAAEDYDLWLRLSERGEVAILPETLGCYRRHRGAVSRSSAVRQVFSARLARRAAQLRRGLSVDPLAQMTEAPDWWEETALSQFFAEDARLARFLALAEPARVEMERLAVVSLPDATTVRQMTHAEKRLARHAVTNIVRLERRPPHLTLWRLARVMTGLTIRKWL